MTIRVLCEPKAPWIHIVVAESQLYLESVTESIAHSCAPDTVVRILSGERMQDFNGLFDEFVAQLRFPDYFGRNFNALSECLADMDWLPGDGYVVIIRDTANLLAREDAEDLCALLSLFERIGIEWSTPIVQQEAWDRGAVPFNFVLHTRAKDLPGLRKAIQESGVASLEHVTG